MTLPNGLFNLVYLKFLDVSNNMLGTSQELGSCLTEAIGAAQTLVELRLSWNMLTHLPESFGMLRNLEVLDLRDNKLVELPVSFGNLTKLTKL